MTDFMQYGTLPHDYGIGASRKDSSSGSGGGTGTDPELSLETLQTIETKQATFTRKRLSIAWSITMFTAARATADAEYATASRDLDLVRALRTRAKNEREGIGIPKRRGKTSSVVVSDLPKAVRTRFASLLPGTGKGTDGGKGDTDGGKGDTGGARGRGAGWEAAQAAAAAATAAGAAPADVQAAAAAAGAAAGTSTEIIAGVSNTTLLLLGGGAILAFVLLRRKGNKDASVFKGI
jgi:hypothetical protein